MAFSKFLFVAALTGAPLLFAVETRSWTHNSQQDFESGTLRNLSLRSDGRLMLAPLVRELTDPSTAYLWALAVDSKKARNLSAASPGSCASPKARSINWTQRSRAA